MLLNKTQELTDDYNTTIEAQIASAVALRVFSEIKRHRTLGLGVESIYNAIKRACGLFREGEIIYIDNPEKNIGKLEQIFSIPPAIKSNNENLRDWVKSQWESLLAYEFLTENGIPESDAVQVIPRGINLGVEKVLDLYNLGIGYSSIRSCGTAEEEMRRRTKDEIRLSKEAINNPAINYQMITKCAYVGFCMEQWKKCCHAIDQYVGFGYTEEVHKRFDRERRKAIESIISEIGSKN